MTETLPINLGIRRLRKVMPGNLDEYARTTSQTTRDELILEHLWLVRHLASRLVMQLPSGIDAENIEAAGMLGLVEAATRFDASQASFKRYAGIRIRGAMLDELRRNCPLPQEMLQQVQQVQKVQSGLTVPATIEELMAGTGLTRDQVLDCLAAMPLTSVQPLEHVSAIGIENPGDTPDSRLHREDQKRIMTEAITALPKRERLVVTLYYNEQLRLKEIGHVLKLSESSASRLLTSAQFQMREYIRQRPN